METTKFETGAVRSADRAKQRYDLISPIGLRRLAETCHEGAVKYSDFNWERGMPVNDILNHAISHLYAYLSGDRSEDHLAHAGWNCFAAMHSEELWPQLNEGKLRKPGCVPPCGDYEDDRPTDTGSEPPIFNCAHCLKKGVSVWHLEHCGQSVTTTTQENPGTVVKECLTTDCGETGELGEIPLGCTKCGSGGHATRHCWKPVDITHGPVRHNATSSNPAMVPTPPVHISQR